MFFFFFFIFIGIGPGILNTVLKKSYNSQLSFMHKLHIILIPSIINIRYEYTYWQVVHIGLNLQKTVKKITDFLTEMNLTMLNWYYILIYRCLNAVFYIVSHWLKLIFSITK